jgi:beta-lactam-binding protein with PASTA domain
MKTFFRFVLLTLILLSVAMVSALTAMRFAIHGREVAVPKLVGLTRVSAEQQANASGLILEVENHFYSPDVAEGKVVSQLPSPGSLVRRGWKVRVAESLGPQKAQVPNLVGESARAAEINVRRRGLEVGSVAVANLEGVEVDQIVAQSPPADFGLAESPKISVLIAAPERDQQFVMPNFVGKRVSEVRAQIEDAGFKLRIYDPGVANPPAQSKTDTSKVDAAKDAALVIKQSPMPGQRIAAGVDINFEVMHVTVPSIAAK